jgi:hypothetical protein
MVLIAFGTAEARAADQWFVTEPGQGQDDGKQDDGKQERELTALFNVVCYYSQHKDLVERAILEDRQKDGQDDGKQDDGKQDGDKDKDKDKYKTCKAISIFEKVVTAEGAEVTDESPEPSTPLSPQVPRFSVECDGLPEPVYNNYARRFTDLLSTRIQALTGPKPAIYLPRGALHVGYHVADSYLDIDTGIPTQKQLRIPGKCNIYTGRP